MTVLAIDCHLSGVQLVGKGDGLGWRVADSVPLGARDKICESERQYRDEDRDRHTDLQRVVKSRFVHQQLSVWNECT